MIHATICFLTKGNPIRELMMGYKKRGFGKDKWTGTGGKVDPGEHYRVTAVREVEEETGVVIQDQDLEYAAKLLFCFPYHPTWDFTVYVFTADRWSGEAQESPEIRPAWFSSDAIPYDQMWDDCRYWMPPMLAGEKFQARIIYGEDNDTVIDHEFAPLGEGDWNECTKKVFEGID
ncbi:MAG: NUDIX domain-containing protein [candidate division Zixibacteria bacterium]|nr:8-oxo-dGTP diphosphatase [candidate division Zixibacteria bacterium]NIR63468.1 8-oxo-dGTP diphosphatase [candidate division Zixibacteria bacterium]NIS45423.1 8-oxo-dGTP diphosphatase [candidate division Zixibacteria bacterium]NIU13560.1 8-oxo-dGTP diphosphatase [candidate division Zixibacteria bacterium]NIV05578.1 NUDIX domain-containing protein [candidate division Zixibacteria bacterium]